MAVPLEQFVKYLEDSGILAGDTLKDFLPPKSEPKSAEELALELVRQKKLTKFQAEEVSKGKSLTLGNYVLIEKIGAGGMGQVFKARHRIMERLVAVKVLPTAMTKDTAAIARFHREVKAAAKLRHPNIVAADDADQANGVHFLVMELVDGSDLSALVKKNGPFSIEKAVNYILQAARGLEGAHAEGIVHRDIKPANLLLDKKGTVKILDMGLARIHGDAGCQAELTTTGAVMGTVDYMAPEQARSTKNADARADVYSLGCSLFYLLTGKAIYAGDTLTEKLLAHQDDPIPELREILPDVPEQLEAVFRKMVAKKAEDRYQTMREVISALEKCGNQPPASRQETADSFVETVLSDTPHEFSKPPTIVGRKKSAGPAFRKDKKKLIGGGVAGGLVLMAIIMLSLKPKGETSVAKSELEAATEKRSAGGTNEASPPSGTGAPRLAEKGWHGWPADAPPPAIAPFDAAQAKRHQEEWAKYLGVPVVYTNSIGMKFRLIPPGEFMMGSTPKEVEEALITAGVEVTYWKEYIPSEAPQHKVILTQPICLGVHEVTQAQYEQVLGKNPSYFAATGPEKERSDLVAGMDTTSHPVEAVSWIDAAEFCTKLSQREQLEPFYFRSGETVVPQDGTGYRLPTEAEWEFACRGGTVTKFWSGAQDEHLLRAGWFCTNAGGRTHAVGELMANPFGLYDIHGNVWEWVQDWWGPTYYGEFDDIPAINPNGPPSAYSVRVFRGGSWLYCASSCRASLRHAAAPPPRYLDFGFRVSLTVDAVRQALKINGPALPQVGPDRGPKKPLAFELPGFDQWVKDIAAMPAEKQVEAVAKKLQELNPGFDGKVTGHFGKGTPLIENGVVTQFGFDNDNGTRNVTDLSPLRALGGLKWLWCGLTTGQLADLSPLTGMQLVNLCCPYTRISDLSPLTGMKLQVLDCAATQVSDLSPLKGMPLDLLGVADTPVSDLSILQGMMSLKRLMIGNTQVTDLRPLQGMRLDTFVCNGVSVSDLSLLKDMPLKYLSCDFKPERDTELLRSIKTLVEINGKPVAEFWKEVEEQQKGKKP